VPEVTITEVVDAEILWTPTGVFVTDAEPESDEWFAARREGITATDLPKILGLSKYGNGTSVWADKLGLTPPDEASEAGKWGRILEAPVADDWAAKRGVRIHRVPIIGNIKHQWRRAALDRITDRCPDGDYTDSFGCPVEVKTRSAFTAGRWRDDVPDDVLAQTHWQMIATGFRHVHVAALLGGQKAVEYRVDYDESVADLCIAEAERIWHDVASLTRPVEDPDALMGRVLDALFPERRGAAILTALQADALAVAYRDACALESQAKAAKAAAHAAILDALGASETAVIRGALGDRTVFTYRQVTRRAFTTPETTYRQLRLVKGALDDTDQ
jgi:putative phage-type endonuclease